jgi:hypothetical protein
VAIGSNQLITEMSTRKVPEGKDFQAGKTENFAILSGLPITYGDINVSTTV